MKTAIIWIGLILALSAVHNHAQLDYTGGLYIDQLTSTAGWHAYQSDGGALYLGRADLHWIEGSPPVGGSFISYPADKAHDLVVALVLHNATPSVLGCFRLNYVGEQLLINTVAAASHESGLNFTYGVSADFVPLPKVPNTVFPQVNNPDDFNKGYTPIPSLSFGAWRFGTTSQNLDGNAPQNQHQLSSGYQPIVWKAGEYLVLRWFADGEPESIPDKLAVVAPHFLAARFAFANVQRLASGQVRLTLCGIPGDVYTVERSANLKQWASVGVVTNTGGFLDATDTNAIVESQMFYRARLH